MDLTDEFSDGRIQFAFVRVKDPNSGLPKFVLIAWVCTEAGRNTMPTQLTPRSAARACLNVARAILEATSVLFQNFSM